MNIFKQICRQGIDAEKNKQTNKQKQLFSLE